MKHFVWMICIILMVFFSTAMAMEEETTDRIVAVSTVIMDQNPIAIPSYVDDLINVASAELGYVEGDNNYSKYGEWSGDANAAWCAEFLCWSVDQTDMRYGTSLLEVIYPNYTGQNTGRDWFIAQGRFVYRNGNCPDWGYQWILGEETLMSKNDYIPRAGDWVFFSLNSADTVHVAMVLYCTLESDESILVHVIEGNNPSAVEMKSYNLTDSTILGYGTPVRVVGTTMRYGNEGQAVLDLQNQMVSLGLLDEAYATGTYGGQTRVAISAFQSEFLPNKTSSIGIADMETQNALDQFYIAMLEYDPNTWLVVE